MDSVESVIETKGNMFLQLWQINPALAIFFIISTLAVLALITIGLIAKFNHGLFNKIIDAKTGKHEEKNKQLEAENEAALNAICDTSKRIEEALTSDRNERLSRQNEVDNRFDNIDEKITDLQLTIEKTGKKLDKVSQGTLLNMLFNENLDNYNRMKAFIRLSAMHINGDVKAKGISLALKNKEVWKIVAEEIKTMGLNIKNQNYFDNTINELNKLVFDKVA